MNPESKRPITLEDLLRLKSAERPRPEFWTDFDRELRAKQLAALVAKRPWWQSLPRIFAGFSRYHVPLGATAIVVLTFISVRHYQSGSSRSALPLTIDAQSAHGIAILGAVAMKPAQDVEMSILQPVFSEQLAGDIAIVTEVAVAAPAPASIVVNSNEVTSVTSLLNTTGPAAELPSKHYPGASLAITPVNDAMTRGLFAPARAFEVHPLPAKATIEPLQQITPPSERSRAKLLTAMLSMTSTDTPVHQTDRVASKLSEERLYDQIHRLSARGAGVSMKF